MTDDIPGLGGKKYEIDSCRGPINGECGKSITMIFTGKEAERIEDCRARCSACGTINYLERTQ